MQNREFENKVQGKMDELKLTPSDAVWDKVEASLPKEKKRRWVMFILLFAALMISSLVLWNKLRTNDTITTAGSPVKKEAVQQNAKESGAFKKDEASTGTVSKNSITTVSNSDDTKVAANKKNIHRQASFKTKIKNGTTGLSNDDTVNDDAIIKEHKKIETNAAVQIKVKPAQPVEEGSLPAKINDTTTIAINNDNNEPVIAINDSGKTINKNFPLDTLTMAKKDTALTVVQKTKKQKAISNWHYGIELAGGVSNVKANLFGNDHVYYNGMASAVSGFPSGNPVSIDTGKPARNAGFSIGFYAERNIYRKWTFRTGLNYLYQSNTIKVGTKIDSSINFSFDFNKSLTAASYYHRGNSATYKNKFHLLEIPLIFQYQFSKASRFYAEAGPSITYLLQSNALVYSTRAQAYVTDRDIFNKLCVSINAGAAINLLRRSALPFSIGYRFKYSMGSVVKTSFGKQHFINSLLYLKIPLKE